MKLNKNLTSGIAAFGLILALAACAETVTPDRSPQQVWIDTHPTHLGSDGECIEFDGEPCDDDPFDWFDAYHNGVPSTKSSPKPLTKVSSRPTPVKTPGPVKTTNSR